MSPRSHPPLADGTFVSQGGTFPNPDAPYRPLFDGMTGATSTARAPGAGGGGLVGVGDGFAHVGAIVSPEDAATAEHDRDADAQQDAAVEAQTGFGVNRATRDIDRATPFNATRTPSHPAKDTQLPIPDAVRTPMSGRQRRLRATAKTRAMKRWSARMTHTVHDLFDADRTDHKSLWSQLNTSLEQTHGSLLEVADRNPTLARRAREIDRAIRTGEQESDRTHIVYTNVLVPPGAPTGGPELTEWTRTHLQPGHPIAFDGYTIGAHTLHEVSNPAGEEHPSIVYEIRTRRGLYLGNDERSDRTTHLLPRAHRGRVVGVHQARYQRPDGTRGTRTVVQVEDIDLTTPDETP